MNTKLENIVTAIQTELLKRGFTAKLSTVTEPNRNGGERVEITSEPFNTVPVIMSEIKINGVIRFNQNDEHEHLIDVGVSVGVAYEHFSGGRNGTELFNFSCKVRKNDDKVYGIRIS